MNDIKNETEGEENIEVQEKEVKVIPPKIPIAKAPHPFANANKFKGGANNFNNKQRPGRAAARGR